MTDKIAHLDLRMVTQQKLRLAKYELTYKNLPLFPQPDVPKRSPKIHSYENQMGFWRYITKLVVG